MPGRFAEPVFVPYHAPLQRGTLVERRDRFIAEVSLDGQQSVLAHCINPGRMEAFVRPGARVWVLPTEKADRKLRYSWEAIEVMGVRGANIIASTNTVRPNVLVRALLEARRLHRASVRLGALSALSLRVLRAIALALDAVHLHGEVDGEILRLIELLLDRRHVLERRVLVELHE